MVVEVLLLLFDRVRALDWAESREKLHVFLIDSVLWFLLVNPKGGRLALRCLDVGQIVPACLCSKRIQSKWHLTYSGWSWAPPSCWLRLGFLAFHLPSSPCSERSWVPAKWSSSVLTTSWIAWAATWPPCHFRSCWVDSGASCGTATQFQTW